MPSADFSRYVAMPGAAGLVIRRCLFRGSLVDSYPPTANGHTGFLVIRVNPFRILLISLLPHGKQISPDKNANFPCTNAAFTLPPEPAGFVLLCQLAQGLSLICGFCSPDQVRGRLWLARVRFGFLRTPPRGDAPRFSGSSTCLRLLLLVVFISMNTIGSRTGDFHPISSRPCRAYTTTCSRPPSARVCARHESARALVFGSSYARVGGG